MFYRPSPIFTCRYLALSSSTCNYLVFPSFTQFLPSFTMTCLFYSFLLRSTDFKRRFRSLTWFYLLYNDVSMYPTQIQWISIGFQRFIKFCRLHWLTGVKRYFLCYALQLYTSFFFNCFLFSHFCRFPVMPS